MFKKKLFLAAALLISLGYGSSAQSFSPTNQKTCDFITGFCCGTLIPFCGFAAIPMMDDYFNNKDSFCTGFSAGIITLDIAIFSIVLINLKANQKS